MNGGSRAEGRKEGRKREREGERERERKGGRKGEWGEGNRDTARQMYHSIIPFSLVLDFW